MVCFFPKVKMTTMTFDKVIKDLGLPEELIFSSDCMIQDVPKLPIVAEVPEDL